MDKRTATITLAEKLRELGYSNRVRDQAIESYLLNNAKSVVLDLEEGRLNGKFYFSNDEAEPRANYFFNIREGEGGNWVTSVALIGEVEERILRKEFYKDVPDEVVKAFEVLEIPNFIEYYKTYSSLSEDDYFLLVTKRFSSEEFLNFVFSLPYEDQNIAVNKLSLQTIHSIDFCEVLLKEYLEDKHFKDYFSVLDEDMQKKVVDKIKASPRQNNFLNSWLFSKGFTLKLDYLELYKGDSGNFIDYFNKSDDELQKLIVSDIFNCEHTNPEVIKFLEEKYPHLLRDIAFKE